MDFHALSSGFSQLKALAELSVLFAERSNCFKVYM